MGALLADIRWPRLADFDGVLLAALLGLVMLGYVAMSSASVELADSTYGDAFYHVKRHGIYLVLAVIAGVAAFQVSTDQLARYGGWLLILGGVLLCVVLVVGRDVNGSRRWLALGPLTLQVSEFVKIFVLLYMAGYLVRRQREVRNHWIGFIKPMLLMGILTALLLAEPDFGTAVVMMGAVMGMLFLGGARLWQFIALAAVALLAAAAIVLTSDYRRQRLLAFTDPWAHQFESGYQLVQSLIAFGSGKWFGVGLGNSVQKLSYLPEAHTDFVLAILGEELGAAGVLLVLVLFAVLIGRIMWLGRRSELLGYAFGAYLCYGAGLLLALQVFINMGVNLGLLPTKGLTLPFFSYGGSSLISSVVLVALVAAVWRRALASERGEC